MFLYWLGLATFVFSSLAIAQPPPVIAYISIIIDDMGDQRKLGEQALKLPGPLTYAFLPHTPYSRSQATQAHNSNKEVMLHLPMQAMTLKPLGPGSLTLDMNRQQFIKTLQQDLDSVPHVVGINNHMGSLLTRHPGHMQWLMAALKNNGNLFFIDSRTTHHTVAARIAKENQLPVRQRDVFLDDDPSIEAINFQFRRLVKKALKNGVAIGIGHPYKNTIQVLKNQLPQLAERGIKLIPASKILQQPITRMAEKTTIGADSLVYHQQSDSNRQVTNH